jgi:hypothetical protein
MQSAGLKLSTSLMCPLHIASMIVASDSVTLTRELKVQYLTGFGMVGTVRSGRCGRVRAWLEGRRRTSTMEAGRTGLVPQSYPVMPSHV